MRTKLAIYGVALFLIAIFIIQNAEMVNIRLFFWDIEMPRVILLIVSFMFGALFWAGANIKSPFKEFLPKK